MTAHSVETTAIGYDENVRTIQRGPQTVQLLGQRVQQQQEKKSTSPHTIRKRRHTKINITRYSDNYNVTSSINHTHLQIHHNKRHKQHNSNSGNLPDSDMPPLSDRSIDSEDENDPDSAYDSQGNSTSIDISCNKYDSTPQLNDRSTVTIDDSDPESDCNSESDTINNTDDATHTSTPYDPSTSYISRQCYLQQHRRQRQPILQIHGDALGVKEDDSVRILFESFNGLAAWKPRNDKILLARRLLHRLKVDCYTGTECNVQWNLL